MSEAFIDNLQIQFDTETLWVLNISLAIVMFGVALEISPKDFLSLLKSPKPLFTGMVSQFFILPLITFILVQVFSPYPSIALGMFMVAACPGGNVSNYISQLAGGNPALSVSLTAMATLLAVFLTPLNLNLWASFYGPTSLMLQDVAISPLAMVQLVALLLAIPLLLGMWVNSSYPEQARRLSGFFRKASLLFFMVLVLLAVKENQEIMFRYLGYVFWIVLAHNFLALITGFSFARLLGNSKINSRTVAIETGIQNSALGLLLIFTFFDGIGGMALLAAFWGIWHLVSGLLLATFWGRRPINQNKGI